MMYSKPQIMTCDTCVWATRFKDGLRCIDGKPVDKTDGCRVWQPESKKKPQADT